MRSRLFGAAVLLCGLAGAPAVHAEELLFQQSSFFDAVDEVRVGGAFHQVYGGLFPFDPALYSFARPETVSFDVLFRSPEMFAWFGSPRPEFGATVSLTGYESMAHLGLTWQLQVFDSPFFIQGTFGAALNNGYTIGAPAGYKNMGCNLGFYESAGIGADLPGKLTATLTYEHTSNLSLCTPNEGLSNLKFQLGMKF